MSVQKSQPSSYLEVRTVSRRHVVVPVSNHNSHVCARDEARCVKSAVQFYSPKICATTTPRTPSEVPCIMHVRFPLPDRHRYHILCLQISTTVHQPTTHNLFQPSPSSPTARNRSNDNSIPDLNHDLLLPLQRQIRQNSAQLPSDAPTERAENHGRQHQDAASDRRRCAGKSGAEIQYVFNIPFPAKCNFFRVERNLYISQKLHIFRYLLLEFQKIWKKAFSRNRNIREIWFTGLKNMRLTMYSQKMARKWPSISRR